MASPTMIGRRLKALRMRANLSQSELARRAEIPRASVILVENGTQKTITLESALRIAKVLGISVEQLASGDLLDVHHDD